MDGAAHLHLREVDSSRSEEFYHAAPIPVTSARRIIEDGASHHGLPRLRGVSGASAVCPRKSWIGLHILGSGCTGPVTAAIPQGTRRSAAQAAPDTEVAMLFPRDIRGHAS